MKKKVLVGMSGGVDSSVSALMLKEQGYEVTGVSLKLCPDKYSKNNDINDAKLVAEKLKIDHITIDLTDMFNEMVIDNFVNEYENGRTPNPCIRCNKYLKFGKMYDEAIGRGFDFVSTGHYAFIEYDSSIKKWLLKKADSKKDQSYVLYNLTQSQLPHIIFPLAKFEKENIRMLAQKAGLPIASKPDSQEICFIKNESYIEFINRNFDLKAKKGHFVDLDGNVLGQHEGILKYTIGQRKGLGITFGKPMYVVRIDNKSNDIVLGELGTEYSSELIAKDLNFIHLDNFDEPIEVMAKIRYQAKEQKATIQPMPDGKAKVYFDTKQRSITPGQSVVFYDGNIVLGGGIIDKVL